MEIKKVLSLSSLFILCNLISKSFQQGLEYNDEINDEIDNEIDIGKSSKFNNTNKKKYINDIIFGNQLLKNECCDKQFIKCLGTTITEM